MKATAVALLLAVTVFGVGQQPSAFAAEQQPAIGIRMIDGPTDTAGGLATDRISHVLPAGKSASWTVEVYNSGPQSREIPVTVGAAVLEDGQFQPADDAPSELTGWVTIDPESPEVPTEGTAEVTVTIDVPDDATDGDHAGVIWASATTDGQITQVNRIGLRTLVTVADGLPLAGFTIDHVGVGQTDGGTEELQVYVTNTGGRMLEVAGDVDLHGGPGGVSAGEIPLPPTTIASGDTATLTAPLDPDLPAGEWTADATVVGDHLSDQASAAVTLGQEAVPGAPAADSRTPLISLAGLLLALALLALLAARRRDRDEEHDPEPERQLAGV